MALLRIKALAVDGDWKSRFCPIGTRIDSRSFAELALRTTKRGVGVPKSRGLEGRDTVVTKLRPRSSFFSCWIIWWEQSINVVINSIVPVLMHHNRALAH